MRLAAYYRNLKDLTVADPDSRPEVLGFHLEPLQRI
jgi:hypothetical protein